jgi:hypothetical protein
VLPLSATEPCQRIRIRNSRSATIGKGQMQLERAPASNITGLIEATLQLSVFVHWHRNQYIRKVTPVNRGLNTPSQQGSEHPSQLPLIAVFHSLNQAIKREFITIRGNNARKKGR